MSNIKRYEINYLDLAWVTVDVNHDIMTEKELEGINSFWTDDKYRKKKHGSVLNAVLAMLAAEVMHIQFEHEYLIEDLIEQFNWESKKGVEGWPPMNGSYGLEIIDTAEIEIDVYEMIISEIARPEQSSQKS